MAQITEPTLWEKLFSQMYQESIDRIKTGAPAYTALLPSDPGIAVLDAFLYQAALLGEKLNILPHASLISWLNYLGIEKKGGAPAVGSVRIELEEALDVPYIISQDTRFLDQNGNSYISTQEVTVNAGETIADIPIRAEAWGTTGNAGANQIIYSYQTLAYVKDIYNPLPLAGGFDSELDDDALDRGRTIIRHLWRAVTPSDYEDLANSVSGIGRAKAIESPGAVNLYLLDEDGLPASGDLRSKVLSFLDSSRVQGVALQVLPAGIKEIDVTANVKLMPGFSPLTVTTLARITLSKVLDPLTWAWGRKVVISEIFAALEETQGVNFVDEIILPVENIYLEPYELAKLGELILHAV